MPLPPGVRVVCDRVVPERIVSGEAVQVIARIENDTADPVTVTATADMIGPAYPPDSPRAGEINELRLDSETTVVGANSAETFQTPPVTVDLRARPAGEYDVVVRGEIA